jgi:hypothetical protein
VTVHVEAAPELRLVGLHESALTVVGATSEIDAVLELPLYDAVTTAVWLVVIVPAVAEKLAEVAPEATVTDAGTESAVVMLESVTAIPPEPAACESVTVHVETTPELRLVGLHESALTVVGTSDTFVV